MGGAHCRIRATHLVDHALPSAASRKFTSSAQTLAVLMHPIRTRVDGFRVLVASGSSEVDDRAGQRSHDALNGLNRGHDQSSEGVDVCGLNEHHDVVGSSDCLGRDHAGHAADGSGDVGCSAGFGLDQDVRSKNRCLLIVRGKRTEQRGRLSSRLGAVSSEAEQMGVELQPAHIGCGLWGWAQHFR